MELDLGAEWQIQLALNERDQPSPRIKVNWFSKIDQGIPWQSSG